MRPKETEYERTRIMSNTNRDLEPEDAQKIERRIDAILEKTF